MIFYGLTTSIQDLGLNSMSENGIFLGVTQTIGYFISLPFAHKMQRKKWSIIYQLICLLGAIILIILSKIFEDNDLNKLLKTIISTCLIATVNSAQFPILFAYISEIYPTKMRGLGNALVLFSGKLLGALAPFMENFSIDYGLHVLVGCSSFLVVSIPLSFFVKETLVDKKEVEVNKSMKEESVVVSLEKNTEKSREVNDDYIELK